MRLVLSLKNIFVAVGWPVVTVLKLLWKVVSSYLFIGSIILGICGLLVWFYLKVVVGLPNVNEIYTPPKLSTKILDRNGKLLYKFYEDEDRSWVPLSKIPKYLILATLAIEDKNFLQHPGISIKGITQAIFYNIWKRGTADNLRGGSTITQQLVKSVFFSNERTWNRKMKEAILALMVERKLSKEEILERYFNQVAYGGEIYGVEEAARKYFGKDVWELKPAQTAYLAGLPAAPSAYSPTGNNPQFGILRQKHVIGEMKNAEFITDEESKEMMVDNLEINISRSTITAPHFVFYIKEYLENKFGYQNFARRGMVVTTSLDLDIQKMAESVVSSEVAAVSRMRISNGATVVLNPKNGEIMAMVGSKNYFATDIEGKYNVTTALRQPGSSIKPINYLLALQKGMSLGSIIDDNKIAYTIPGQGKPYVPVNYNGKYMGRVTLRTALASSLNIPSVKLLARNGVENMIDLAEYMGINTWTDRSRFGLSLALGSGEVKMIELANAYSTFANMGIKTELSPVLTIDNYLGERIFSNKTEPKEIVDPKLAFMINSVLSDNLARSPIFGMNSLLRIDNYQVAVKTGTTNNLRDNWCIGWNSNVLVATWVGNNDGTPMSWVASGVSGATPIWNKIMKQLIKNKGNDNWIVPPVGVYKKNICGKDEYYINGRESEVKCLKYNLTPTPIN